MKKLTAKILIIALCAVFGSCKTKKRVFVEYPQTQTETVEEVVFLDPVDQEEELVDVPEPSLPTPSPISSIEKDDLSTARNEQVVLSDSEQNSGLQLKKYNVVVGSFSNKANAERLQAKLNEEGYNALVAVNENGMHRVIALSSDESKPAKDKIQAVKDRFSDVWMLIQK